MQRTQLRRPRRSRDEWASEVVRWRRSGQSAAEYAAKHGLHEGTLAAWATKLGSRREECEEVQPRFVPVRVAAPGARDVKSGRPIEVVLRNGRRVRVESNFDQDLLLKVITVLEGGSQC